MKDVNIVCVVFFGFISFRVFGLVGDYNTFVVNDRSLPEKVGQSKLGSISKLHDNGNENITKQMFNEQRNSCARALSMSVHFFAVLCKTTT